MRACGGVGNLVTKLTENAKSVFPQEPGLLNAKIIMRVKLYITIKINQLTADHYRFRFRTSEKQLNEDFVHWGNHTRRYMTCWMKFTKATGNAEKLLDTVSPEL